MKINTSKREPLSSFSYSQTHYVDSSTYYLNKADQERIKIILRLIGSNKKVLDIACYNGYIGKKIILNNNLVSGVDASQEAVKSSIKNGLEAKVFDIEKGLPFDDHSFDTVLAGEIIEHIVDTDFLLDEIKRVLKPGGDCIITTPNMASLDKRIMLLFNINPFFPASFTFPANTQAGHLRFFNDRLLLDFLRYKGLKIVSTESDVMSFPCDKYLRTPAKIFPSLGFSIIVKCQT